MKGWVYIAVNESLPGQVKIGYSDRHPDHRMQELSNTSVPTPFMCAYAALCDDPFLLEQLLHRHLDDCRVSPDREFFYLSPDAALIEVIHLAESSNIEITHSEENASLLSGEEEVPNRPMMKGEIQNEVDNAISKIGERLQNLKLEAKKKNNIELLNDLIDIEVAYKNWKPGIQSETVSRLSTSHLVITDGPIAIEKEILAAAENVEVGFDRKFR